MTSLNNSLQLAPNFWLDRRSSVSYPLVVQTPTYRVDFDPGLMDPPGDGGTAGNRCTAGDGGTEPGAHERRQIRSDEGADGSLATQYSAGIRRPCRRRGARPQSTAADIDAAIAVARQTAPRGVSITLSGQIETMRESYNGLFSGMALAVVLVFLLLVINFQSWVDPLIVLMAVPFALCGVMWMLFLSQTHISVPALMGTLMCIGLTTANSILVVTFANQRRAGGIDARAAAIEAGYTRLRPVLMTAGAMILGMIPMALGVGEGGEQNAPLARAVIGGLLFATVATLVLVPTMYSLLRQRAVTENRGLSSART